MAQPVPVSAEADQPPPEQASPQKAAVRKASFPDERIAQVSPDLAYELQARIFDQTATGALAGAGLSVTLIGSVLNDAPPTIWGSVVCFAAAAYVAGAGNTALVEGLFSGKPVLKRLKLYQVMAGLFMGMAIGVLSYSVFVTGQQRTADAQVATQP